MRASTAAQNHMNSNDATTTTTTTTTTTSNVKNRCIYTYRKG